MSAAEGINVEEELLFEESTEQEQSTTIVGSRGRRVGIALTAVATVGLVLALVGMKTAHLNVADVTHAEQKYPPCPQPVDGAGNAPPCYDKITGNVVEYRHGTVVLNGNNDVCFPGMATARVEGRGDVPVRDLRIGDRVLVDSSLYEPLMGFIHAVPGRHAHLTVSHEHGELRVSGQHNVFVADGDNRVDKLASQLTAGDIVFASHDGTPSRVLSVSENVGDAGMYAPLTATGTIIIDGVVASSYANPPGVVFLPHGMMHASFFPARVCQRLGLTALFQSGALAQKESEDMHPLASLMRRALPLLAK